MRNVNVRARPDRTPQAISGRGVDVAAEHKDGPVPCWYGMGVSRRLIGPIQSTLRALAVLPPPEIGELCHGAA